MVNLWTSSGTSAMRSARIWAYMWASGKNSVNPAAPWTWMAQSMTSRAMFGTATLMPAISVAAYLLNASNQVGGALGLAILAAIATSHTHHLLAVHVTGPVALTSGVQRALLASSIFLVVAAAIAIRTGRAQGETEQVESAAAPEPVRV
jgi:hypothetical protein